MTDEIRADVPAKTIRCRAVVRSVDRSTAYEGTPFGIDDSAPGLSPLPSRAGLSIRAGVQDGTPLRQPVVLRTTQAGAGPAEQET